MRGFLFLLFLVGCEPSEVQQAKLGAQLESFERLSEVKRVACRYRGAEILECSGVLKDRAVRYACVIDRHCTWTGP